VTKPIKYAKRKTSAKPARNYCDPDALVGGPACSVIPRVKKGPKSTKRDKVTPELKKLLPQAEVYVAPKAPMSYVKSRLGKKSRRVKGFIIRDNGTKHLA
jgi:hypothetical protein